jgi:hypothetical protein
MDREGKWFSAICLAVLAIITELNPAAACSTVGSAFATFNLSMDAGFGSLHLLNFLVAWRIKRGSFHGQNK